MPKATRNSRNTREKSTKYFSKKPQKTNAKRPEEIHKKFTKKPEPKENPQESSLAKCQKDKKNFAKKFSKNAKR
ncbi:hypothetical protein F8M41_010807 [Gigaspora margarita]|uniref:Uncharacterized protein n=1 Tax=Gigaspora margarita TaxID=4874 RepID=A0A8H3X231_GIGMA|nr:hypothetical protein F8M41_010807 [Gigaspora margarita]